MISFGVLLVGTLVARLVGFAGVDAVDDWQVALRIGLALMFLLTASGHWGSRRADLVAMVPPSLPARELLVTVTGVLEIAGAIGLLLPATYEAAAICLAVMLLFLFPANVRAARKKLTLGGRPATPLPVRTVLQVVFVGSLVAVVL
jgi:uncharacterized membrane protein